VAVAGRGVKPRHGDTGECTAAGTASVAGAGAGAVGGPGPGAGAGSGAGAASEGDVSTTCQQNSTKGEAVQVDPLNPALKAPGARRLKLKYDEPLSNIAFSFHLRRNTKAAQPAVPAALRALLERRRLPLVLDLAGQCRLTLSNPC